MNKLQKKEGYYTKYKVLAIENDAGAFDFYAVKYYQNIIAKNSGLMTADITFGNLDNFTGIVQLTDQDKNVSFSKKLESGELIDSTSFDKNEASDPSVAHRVQENCNILTVPEDTK